MIMKSLLSLTLAGIAGFAPLAQAATLAETSDYSSVATAPTAVGSGYDTVSGSLVGGDWDYFAVSLPATSGAITFDFSLTNTAIANGAGFQLYYSYEPFTGGNNSFSQPYNQWVTQVVTPSSVDLSNWGGTSDSVSKSYVIDFDSTLGSTLYLALVGTFNTAQNGGVSYNVTVPASDLSAVPLPAGGLLLASGLGVAALLRKRKSA